MKLATTPDINLLYTSDNLFMQIVEPEEISYVYKIRPARNFGGDFVSIIMITEHIYIIPSPLIVYLNVLIILTKFHLKFVANDLHYLHL